MTHLRRYLEQTGILAPDLLDTALRRQQIYGGSLDTVLLELKIVDGRMLSELLAQACGLPIAPIDLIERDMQRPWDAIPGELVEIGWAAPLAINRDGIMVAVHPDLPNERLGALYRTVPRVQPMVTPEGCLEAIAGERAGTVVPQRYAVLSAAYLADMRMRQPSGAGVPEPDRAIDEQSTVVYRAVRRARPPRRATPLPWIQPPPVRFPARATPEGRRSQASAFDEDSVLQRMVGAKAGLQAARDKDAAFDALAHACSVISPRVALFRLREEALVGLAISRSALDDVEGSRVPLTSALRRAIDAGRWTGDLHDEHLRAAVGVTRPVPCMLARIDVASRPAMVLYLDHDGRELLPAEVKLVGELCEATGLVLARILRNRRIRKASSVEQRAITGWGPPPANLRDVVRVPTEDTAPRLPPLSEPPYRPRRTHVDGSPSHQPADDDERGPMLTVPAMPPPPALPPPPPMRDNEDSKPRPRPPDTLVGLPDPVPSAPRFIPPGLDDSDDLSFISLAPPIHETVRGQIQLDAEDWGDVAAASSEHERQVDVLLGEIGAGNGDLDALRALGEHALSRLADQFPGPIEVLRRDLRALPPPSAHGPYLRAAIVLGAPMVPYLVDLCTHANPDVRFYAAFSFQELRDTRCMNPLSALAFDHSGDVRVIAMRVLETYGRHPGFAAAASIVSDELASTNRTRQLYAARAVGTLRDIGAIPELVDLLAAKDRFIQEAALESLCSITGQQHGLKPHRWRKWYAHHGRRHRVEWIIHSLKHRDPPVRRWANDELIRITGHRVDAEDRYEAAEAWAQWWTAQGRVRLGTQEQNAG